jgi:hypothetical protein
VSVAVGVLVAAGVASAATPIGPVGFRDTPRLEAAASWVAGKPVHVWCATSQSVWATAAANGGLTDTAGFVMQVGGSDEYLSTRTCAALNAYLNRRGVDEYDLARRLLVLAHESEHLHGIADESEADCAALRAMPTMIRRWFPPRRGYALHDVMAYAWDAHQREPAAYTRLC